MTDFESEQRLGADISQPRIRGSEMRLKPSVRERHVGTWDEWKECDVIGRIKKRHILLAVAIAFALLLVVDFCSYRADERWWQEIQKGLHVGMPLSDCQAYFRRNVESGNILNLTEYGGGQVMRRVPEWKYGGGVHLDFGGKIKWLVFQEYGAGDKWGGEEEHWFTFNRRSRSFIWPLLLEGMDGLLYGAVVVRLDDEDRVRQVHLTK